MLSPDAIAHCSIGLPLCILELSVRCIRFDTVQRDVTPATNRSFPGPISELKAESERPLFASRERKEVSGEASAQLPANVGIAGVLSVFFGNLFVVVRLNALVVCPTSFRQVGGIRGGVHAPLLAARHALEAFEWRWRR